ncbi:MAG: HD family phosphohydrolase, partial [Candidatus Promineifilaceae bacterium]
DIYTPLNRRIGLAQVETTRSLFNYIRVVRADTSAPRDHLLSNLTLIEVVSVSAELATTLLDMSDANFNSAETESSRIVAQIMRRPVSDDDLATISQQVVESAPFFDSNEGDQETVVFSIVPELIQPNVLFDQAATDEARASARNEAASVLQSVQKDQIIIRSGQIVDDLHLETLNELGLMHSERNWADVVRNSIVSLLMVGLLGLYFYRFADRQFHRRRYLLLLTVLMLGAVASAEFLLNQDALFRYIYPGAAFAMLLAVVYETRFAIFVTLLIGSLVGYAAGGSLEYAFYAIIGSLVAILSLRGAERINDFFRAGLLAAAGNFIVILLFNFADEVIWSELGQLVGYALVSGGLSAMLTILGFFIIGSLFGITTVLQIQDLSRFDQPLMQELLRRAPGTYHHSVMVANLAERAAEEVKANSVLVRVGAFYHDIGKMAEGPFFTENQEGHNPHDSLDPYESAQIIIGHVTNGLDLARQNGLPERLQDFIAEHHGDQVLKHFYRKACDQAGDSSNSVEIVDPERFRYPGPAPRTRETGIVMLADTVEAASKAVQPNNESAIEKLVISVTQGLIVGNQLDDSGLTMGDIRKIRESFMETLKGRFHSRVKYAGNESLTAANTPPIEAEISTESAEQAPENLLAAPDDAPLESVEAEEVSP